MSSKLVTPKFRVSFVNVFEARENLQGKKKYSVVMLFDKDTDLKPLKALLKEAAVVKWGDKLQNIKLPFRDGNEKEYDGYKDKIFATASGMQKPGLVDDKLQPIIEPSEFYSGCYARATITAFAWEYMGKKGVSFGLQNLQKLDDGEAFSGKSKPEDDFDAIKESDKSETENSELFGDANLGDL